MYCKQNMLEAILWAIYHADAIQEYVPAEAADVEIHLEETAVSGSFFFCAAAAASAETDAANLLEREQLRLFPAFSKWRAFLLHIRFSFFIYIVTTPRKGGSYGKTSSSTHDSFWHTYQFYSAADDEADASVYPAWHPADAGLLY